MPRVRSLAYDARNDKPVNDLEADLKMLKTRFGLMEREISLLSTAESPVQRDDSGAVNRDARWHCNKCGYLLGFYDVSDDVLRTRYKEHIVYVRVGDGGFVQVVCRGCSQVNTQGYVSQEGAEPEAG